MFTNKEIFKKEFKKRCIRKYGNDMNRCHITELYDVLGTMVRDYVAVDWKASKDYVNENHEKQLVYFSMEFLIGRLLVNNMQNLGIYQVAKEGLKENDITKSNINIIKAEKIITELRTTLDKKYEVAKDFDLVYDYIYRKLVEANIQKNEEALEEALKYIREMRETWLEVMRLTNTK